MGRGVAQGLKQGGWDVGRLSKGLGGWGLGSWGGWNLEGWDGHLFGHFEGRMDRQMDRRKEIPLLFFRSSAQEEIP